MKVVVEVVNIQAFSPMWSFMIQMCQYSLITYLKVKIDGRDTKKVG